jgi:uncharacterized membrane protein HdeD (DUF308 family)
MNSLFGPLSHQYCNLFLLLSAFGLFMVFAVILTGVLMFADKKMNRGAVVIMAGGVISYLIIYFQNRILYNMCKSV